jgi:hypothetical protein
MFIGNVESFKRTSAQLAALDNFEDDQKPSMGLVEDPFSAQALSI